VTSHASPRRGTVSALFIAHGMGSMAVGITGVVVAVGLFDRSGSTGWATVGAIVRVAPFVALSAVAGTFADRRSPRAALLIAVAAQAVAAAILLAIATDAPLLALAAVGFAAHSAWTLAYPSMAALLARSVPAERLGPTNGVLSTVESLAWIGGPGLGGIVMAASGTRAASAVALAAAAGALVTLAAVKVSESASTSVRASFTQAMREGVRALTSSRGLVAALLLHLASNLVYGAMSVLLLVAATARFGMDSGGYGILTGALSAGSLAALVVVRRLTSAPALLPMLSGAVLLCGAPIAVMAAVDAPVWAIALTAASGAGTVLAEVVALTNVQRSVPLDTVGRVFGLLDSLTVGVVLAGTASAGLLVDLIGLERSMVVFGAMVPALVVFAAPKLLRVRGGATVAPIGQLLASLPMLYLARPSSLEPAAHAQGAPADNDPFPAPPPMDTTPCDDEPADEDADSIDVPAPLPAAPLVGFAPPVVARDDVPQIEPVWAAPIDDVVVDFDPWVPDALQLDPIDSAGDDNSVDNSLDDGFDDLTFDT
jgi:MFS family permease